MDRTTVGSLLRTTQAFCLQVCEKETLDFGIAYYSPRFPRLAEANQFREVVVSDAAAMATAFEQAEEWFRSHGLTCMRWAPAEGCDAAILGSFLIERGFHEERFSVLHLSHWPEAAAAKSDIRILPARAMRGAFRSTFLNSKDESDVGGAMLADAYAERLDDPQFDMFVAMQGDTAAGRCGLYQVGDIARVIGPNVIAQVNAGAIQEAMLRHVLAMAHRLTFRNVCAQVEESDAASLLHFERYGFIQDGRIVEFARREG
ncbi:MAG: hypothetical protein HY287_11820 [Planctomycetes bacterium]|nr:hypothetical protein [Planctomycetota bacterium]